ncbi:hypothetical protein CYLTODRAFT_150232 [Cylindrobasidium torrendii FP15055 ss-10]|uniref:Uncharacterized protein n=1 Tax=Cylindrobasidium torrendii FP15055 ss-10 TaxID=1314674 RepID=A0A0D7B0L2_9AGAR|nr:hypothetical protein CYLTODRAFT_150232 [Cylindrobasidium torrendii FP15055 ss-10]
MPAPLTKNKDKPKRVKHKRTISDGLAKSPLSTVPLPAAVVPTTKISPTAFRCIGSYSWATGEKNTIVVPGCPVILQTTTLPLQLKRRSHKHFVDQNGHRVPSCPLLPIFLAVPTTFDWSLVHVVAERNSLRKLLGWVQGRKKAFKIDLELVGETVLLYRWSEKTRVTIPNNDFGAAFEEAVTRPADGSPIPTHGHYRIVEYEFVLSYAVKKTHALVRPQGRHFKLRRPQSKLPH